MVVTIDDKLPYWKRPGRHGNLCFAKQTKENEFWPCLLEKAVAKFVMSYHRIDGGFEASHWMLGYFGWEQPEGFTISLGLFGTPPKQKVT